jgi:hypothetical protein
VSRSAGGLVLLLIGSLALIGYLTGNLDRWLAFLFTPPAESSTSSAGTGPVSSSPGLVVAYPPGGNARQAIVA